ncbi:MAG: Amidophosphoribosyltransferase [Candidatus Moanabacter tarae]|uniref:Amidophosphoribosyltransferase n=1 Tax=Candidatus Moanibacter tarae TaxID=2200854 RepID=A0A2Z4AEP9_9BACT|nr:MAG: Amidophosphoribosyltransferase [Candidatus Moanabacter tarae]
MCGIAGIMYKGAPNRQPTGKSLVGMLDGCQHRGPDSTGFALYEQDHEGELKLRFLVGRDREADEAIKRIHQALSENGAALAQEEKIGDNYRVTVTFSGDLQSFAYAVEHAAKVISLGTSLDIIKDVGSAQDVDNRYNVGSVKGTHGLGHVRLATESDVKPEAAHPFWATGFADVAIVHNGQITNYWKMRRRLECRGHEFRTDNDSELIAVYLAEKLTTGTPLKEALNSSIEDLDGTFSFLVSTKNEIGYAKDRLAAKPMIMYENKNLIAIASEEVSLNRLFPGQALNTLEPPPGSFDTWALST